MSFFANKWWPQAEVGSSGLFKNMEQNEVVAVTKKLLSAHCLKDCWQRVWYVKRDPSWKKGDFADDACEQWDSLSSVPHLPVDSDTICSSTQCAACIFWNGQKTVSVCRSYGASNRKVLCRITMYSRTPHFRFSSRTRTPSAQSPSIFTWRLFAALWRLVLLSLCVTFPTTHTSLENGLNRSAACLHSTI